MALGRRVAQGLQDEGTFMKQQYSAALTFAPPQETDTCMSDSLAYVPTAKQRSPNRGPEKEFPKSLLPVFVHLLLLLLWDL